METVNILAFRAPERPDLVATFLKEHELVLTELNIPLMVKGDTEWTTDPNCYVIVALHQTEGMVGGLRFQVDHGPGSKLPMSQAISKLDPSIVPLLQGLKQGGNGEVCGLWSANRFANRGVAVLLSTAVTAIAPYTGANSMVCFVGAHTKRHPEKNGFIAIKNIGEDGAFNYPTSEFRSIAMVNPDPVLLPFADPKQRQVIYSLRLRPDQTRGECPARIPLEVKYDLKFTEILDLVAYRMRDQQQLGHTG
ncbi:MAG: hypothetical protein KBA60_06180 [Flavobacteriales bacterium]|nr:hypothetical protein [Flavobacteriales bacterium]